MRLSLFARALNRRRLPLISRADTRGRTYNRAMHAETAYLFRHALLRDAAYDLQLPADRARLHALALHLIEQSFGGQPAGPHVDRWGESHCEPRPIDAVAAELASHAHLARTLAATSGDWLLAQETLYLRRAAEHAERSFLTQDAIRLWQALAAQQEKEEQAQALRRAGVQAFHAARADQCESLLSRALAVATAAADRPAEGAALSNLGILYEHSGRVELAEKTYAKALSIHSELSNRRMVGAALSNLANVHQLNGRLGQATRAFDQALAVYRAIGDRRSEGIVLGNLAIAHQKAGLIEEAERSYEHAVQLHREVGDRRTEGIALGNLANVYWTTGRFELAEKTQAQGLAIHREISDRRSEGVALGGLADIYRHTGRAELAVQTYEKAQAIHCESGNLRYQVFALCGSALGLLTLRQHKQARERWQECARLLLVLNDTAESERSRHAIREACGKAGVPPFDEGAP